MDNVWEINCPEALILSTFCPVIFTPHQHFPEVRPDERSTEYSKPGDYLLAEVRRLARMLIVKVPHSTDWRSSHPYLLIDRLEDVTDPVAMSKSSTIDRTVSMYGWVRGAPLPPALTSPGIHIAGVGDFTVADCTRQPDPCPLPSQIAQAVNQGKTSRHLAERDRKVSPVNVDRFYVADSHT